MTTWADVVDAIPELANWAVSANCEGCYAESTSQRARTVT